MTRHRASREERLPPPTTCLMLGIAGLLLDNGSDQCARARAATKFKVSGRPST